VSLFATLPTESYPVGLAFDTSGNLYEVGLNGKVSKITSNGTVSPFANNLYSGLFIAVTDDAGNPLPLPPTSIPGDYNLNGVVDAADYVLWRKNNNTATTLPNDATPGTSPADYDVWRAQFGQSLGSGTGAGATLRR
jgi:hypothetical protein